MQGMRVLIVDDEPLARRRLAQLLASCPSVAIAAEAEGGREALPLVERLRPDVLLLDIEMPGVDGFAVVKELPPGLAPAIVFVTAFQDHAVQAFELRATDFVVKPVRGDRLVKAIEQAQRDLDARRAGSGWPFSSLGFWSSKAAHSPHRSPTCGFRSAATGVALPLPTSGGWRPNAITSVFT